MLVLVLVEDDDMIGASLRKGLAGRFNVAWACSFAEAEAAVACENHNVAVVDLARPGGSGLDHIRAARARGGHCRS